MSPDRRYLLATGLAFLAGCARLVERPPGSAAAPTSPRAADVVIFALGLIDTGYRFGGRNPEAGIDCSGMVSYVFAEAAGVKLSGSAADIARRGRAIGTEELRPGDLVFFNTLNRPRSHVGIYIGDGRFVHSPSTRGKVRIDSLGHAWFASRFEEARTYFD
jgi:cell wall-associated NlpC family hydrolase